MALQKTVVPINFSKGLDGKSDSFQQAPNTFSSLENSVFTKAGLLQKRNGFGPVSTTGLVAGSKALSTFSGGLLALGSQVQSYSSESQTWAQKGVIQNINLSTATIIRTDKSQTTVDLAIADNGECCTAFISSDNKAYYCISDSVTGQSISAITEIAPGTGAVAPRVFILGSYFIITYINSVPDLMMIAVPLAAPNNPQTPALITSAISGTTAGYDGIVYSSKLYLAWDSSAGAGIRATIIDPTLTVAANTLVENTVTGSTFLSITVDAGSLTLPPTVWISAWNNTLIISAIGINPDLSPKIALVQMSTLSPPIVALTSAAAAGKLTIFSEYNFDTTNTLRGDAIVVNTVTNAGLGTRVRTIGNLGLASKARYLAQTDSIYLLAAYGDTANPAKASFQPSYFLIDSVGNVIAKLAYANGGGFPKTQVLPTLNLNNGVVISIGYLVQDLIQAAGKDSGVTNFQGIYAQTGINLANFEITDSAASTAEIGGSLHLSGGMLWMYDGVKPVEHGFNVYPEGITASLSATGGNMTGAAVTGTLYNYQVTYEWMDGQGNIHRSAPSIPLPVTVAAGNTTSKVTLTVPTLQLTYKTGSNPVKIVVYRWSVNQQTYYQVSSTVNPAVTSWPTNVSIALPADTNSDAQILGNNILYTTGGVVENIGAPATSDMTLYRSRLLLIDAEDPNLIWYSKQVIEATPVELSNLFTIYVAPTQGSQGSTGPITALSAMDDKLIIFKNNAIYYMTGNGPDITGGNNDFSDPVFITSTVGCSNPKSIVFIPNGLMFQSDKGIWLLGRDLSTQYIGAAVEPYNSSTVLSSLNIPGTNQVRLTLDNGITLMYDYFFGQWGSFKNIPAISSTIFQGLHTYINSLGQILQETPDLYMDGSSPTLMSFTTGWFRPAGLQGYQRAYYFFLLGKYFSPHKLNVQIAYDHDDSFAQQVVISPNNFSPVYGADTPYGNLSPYGGPTPVEQFRVNLLRQKCQAMKISVTEMYDPSLGVSPGAGLTLSGINLVVGIKKNYAKISPKLAVG